MYNKFGKSIWIFQVFHRKIAEQFHLEDDAMQDIVDISDSILASILHDILKYKDLMQNDLGLFWTSL